MGGAALSLLSFLPDFSLFYNECYLLLLLAIRLGVRACHDTDKQRPLSALARADSAKKELTHTFTGAVPKEASERRVGRIKDEGKK